MFPLRALPQTRRAPWVTRLLALLCVAVGVWQMLGGAEGVIGDFGARPVCYLAPSACGYDVLRSPREWLAPLFASLFLHASIAHLAFNVWFLWIFGPAVEEKFGHIKFFFFYFVGGLVATAAHFAAQPFSSVPVIGASGAIAAVLGAALVIAPRGWVLSYVPPFWVFPVPAPLFFILWFASQIAGVLGMWRGAAGGVAWLAHIGGFVFGAWWVWRRKRRRKPKQEFAPKRKPEAAPTSGR